MRKVLIHSGMSPLEQPPLDRVFKEHLFTTNSGNLLFQYATYRTLMTEQTQFVSRFLQYGDFTDAFIDQINSEFDCVVLPMANNFRVGFDQLGNITALVRRLKIPCVVIGVGLQANDASEIANGFPFDASVREFVDAILDHSALLGLRGEMTGQYLEKLGYIPERHFTVTGCPSMYTHGSQLIVPKPQPLTGNSSVCFNYRKEQPENLFRFIRQNAPDYPGYSLLMQRVEEMFMLRYGLPVRYDYRRREDNSGLYPTRRSDPAIREGHAVGFANARTWFSFMAEKQFSVGCRIHGNIAAVLAGTPALVFTIDTRTEELCRYHNIPFIPANSIDETVKLRALYENTDFTSVQSGHAQRFQHFVDFLNVNGLRHIYQDGIEVSDAPFDRAVASLPLWGRIEASRFPSPIDYCKGISIYLPRLRAKIQRTLRGAGRK